MRNAHEVAKVRAAERALMARLPAGTLMGRAAAGLASVCAALLGHTYGSRVVILAGSGDNGGDALHAGALLARRGAIVVAIAAGSRTHEAGTSALRDASGRVIGPADPLVPAVMRAADLIIDGMLGIGGRGGLREPYAALAAQARDVRGIVVAADLPSGVDADTGVVDGPAVRAQATVTFGTWKPGLLVDPGATHAGVVELVDIGLGPYLDPPDVAAAQAPDIGALLPWPTADSDKYRRGVVGVLAGSDRFTGAAVLAVGGAVRAGAGMVRLVTTEAAALAVRHQWPEAIITVLGPGGGSGTPGADHMAVLRSAGRVQAWLAGPGMGTGEAAAGLLAAALGTNLPVLVDADGLTLLARDRGLLPRGAPTLLTPHAGELARLLGADRADVEARRLEHARRAAAELHATVLLKGSTTVIAPAPADGAYLGGHSASQGDTPGPPRPRAPRGHSKTRPEMVNPTGTPLLATAGTGDVLSGLAGTLLAQGLHPVDAATAAAYLHGMAARLAATGPGERAVPAWGDDASRPPKPPAAPIAAADVIGALPSAFRALNK